jgi:DNA-formamidopyrimidine glycosylase
MPEGPEVRRHADHIATVLEGEKLIEVRARTRGAKAWLQAHPDALPGRRVLSVRSHGKHLLIRTEEEYFFHAHLMMWGHWQVLPAPPLETDRRERARLVSSKGCAILFSAPIFEIGRGDLNRENEILARLGPDALPYDGEFDAHEFVRRIEQSENADRSIGAVLLDQGVVAGLGNYLRADILFHCRINPWKRAADLSLHELECLTAAIPELARRAYLTGGTTTEAERERIRNDATLLYRAGSEWGTRFSTFRRTNLPCLRCGATIRQQRQVTGSDEAGEEKTRITYFCPTCQGVALPVKP